MTRAYRGVAGHRTRLATLALAMTLLAAACGGQAEVEPTAPSGGGTASPTQPSGTSGTGASSPAAGLEPQSFTVGAQFFHSGFLVDVVGGEILAEENTLTGDVRYALTVEAMVENLAPNDGFFGPDLVVATDGDSYTASFASDIPDVPGGLRSSATFLFDIDEGFDLASARLIVGDGTVSQAVVPLAGGGDVVRLEPSEPAISGMISMELLDLTFTRAELRYDILERHRQVEVGKRALTLHFDALSRKQGNWQVFATDFVLVRPDGTPLGADAVDIGSLPGNDDGVVTEDRWVRFLVDEMPGGDYTLRLTPGTWFVGDDGVTEASFDFTLDP